MPHTTNLDSELDDSMLNGGETPADVQAALEAELAAELDGRKASSAKPKKPAADEPPPRRPIRRSVDVARDRPAVAATPADRPRMSVDVEYVRSDSTKMLNARIDEDLMTHLNLVSAVNKARKTGLPTVRSIIEQALVEWFDRNAPLPGRDGALNAAA